MVYRQQRRKSIAACLLRIEGKKCRIWATPLRRGFGVTHDYQARLRKFGKTPNRLCRVKNRRNDYVGVHALSETWRVLQGVDKEYLPGIDQR